MKLWSEVKDQIKSSDDNNQEDIDIGVCVVNDVLLCVFNVCSQECMKERESFRLLQYGQKPLLYK